MIANSKTVTIRARARAAQRRRGLQAWALAIGALVLVLAVLVLAVFNSDGPSIAHIGAPMPDFTLNNLSGSAMHLADYRGQVVLVNGWATWCPPCRAELPDLQAFYLAHKAEGFLLLAVNSGEDQGPVAAFIGQMQFTFPVLLDPGQRVLNHLGTDGLPTSYVVGRDGVVKTIHIGVYTPDALNADILPLLR